MSGEHDTGGTESEPVAASPARTAGPHGLDEATVISAATPAGPASAAEIGRQLVGTTLGPYRLEQFVGGGGMGAVFRGHDTTLDRVVAVKVLAGRQSDDEEMLRRFRNEAQSAARLDHENIGRVYAVGSEGGWHYIVFEFIEGRNLRDIVRDEGPFGIARAVDVAVQVADALEHASQRSVVHRDIKPSNIVITPNGRARIVDMGLARLHQMAGDRDLTMSGMTLGTFDYISPEQARDPRAADVRSDLYSLGCTIFYMLVGRPPFAEGTMVQKLLQHQQEPPPALETLRPDVPRRLATIVERLMAKDPADRPARPAALVADLVAFAEAEGISLAAPRPVVTVSPPATAPVPALLPWLLPLGGLVALVAALWIDAIRPRLQDTGVEPSAAQPAVPQRVPVHRLVRITPPVKPRDVGDALAAAADGDVIELAFTGTIDVPGFALDGRRLTLRAAPGTRPGLRVVGMVTMPGGMAAACDVGTGALDIRGVAIALAASAAVTDQRALFAVGSGRLACEDVWLEMPGGDAPEPLDDSVGSVAFVVVLGSGANGGSADDSADDDTGASVALAATWACGDAVFLDATAGEGGRTACSWHGGGLITPRQLLAAGGASKDGERVVELTLEEATFACQSGIVAASDAWRQPVPARVRVTARQCTFLTAGAPLVLQSGIGEPADYEAAAVWTNRGSRYEGTDIFRRLDGGAERVDLSFREQAATFRHASRVGAWPTAAAWRSAWEAPAE
jgi:serine/threonine protein kinase